MDRDVLHEMELIASGKNPEGILIVVVDTDTHTPRTSGTWMIVRKDRSIVGSIGGGTVEQSAVEYAGELIEKRISTHLKKYSLGIDDSGGEDTGMICGGGMTVYFELIESPDRLFLFGGGHIAFELAPLAARCGFKVTVIDDRKEITRPGRFGPEINVMCCLPQDYATGIISRQTDSFVIITHDHRHDLDTLKAILLLSGDRPRYIGMIGSRRKTDATFRNLKKCGISEQRLNAVYAPIGLDIGAENPTELAVSILSEMMAVRTNRMPDGLVKSMHQGAL
ncbi:XdhC family protein [bacterium]|nr:XdhC family protein [candidate division CSSED10-310 bacterium]